MTILAVGRNAFKMIEEIRRQVREIPGLLEGTGKPDYASCVGIASQGALWELVGPGLLAFLSPAVFYSGEAKSFIHILISRFDIFSVWYTIAIALGIAFFAKIDRKKALTISFIYLVFKALVLSGFTFLFISIV